MNSSATVFTMDILKDISDQALPISNNYSFFILQQLFWFDQSVNRSCDDRVKIIGYLVGIVGHLCGGMLGLFCLVSLAKQKMQKH
jgi:hypothetical protein